MNEVLESLSLQMDALPRLVHYWINWMGAIFLLSIVFVKKHKAARYVLLAMVLPGLIAAPLFYIFRSIHILGLAHIIVWGPLLYYLMLKELRGRDIMMRSAYGIWIVLLTITVIVSLVFDIRDLVLVLMGFK